MTGHEDGGGSVDRSRGARVVDEDAEAAAPPRRPHGVRLRRDVLSGREQAGVGWPGQDHQGERMLRIYVLLYGR